MLKRSPAIHCGTTSLFLLCTLAGSACGGSVEGDNSAAGGNDSTPVAQAGTGGATPPGGAGSGEAASAGAAGQEGGVGGSAAAPSSDPVTVCADGTTCSINQFCLAPYYRCSLSNPYPSGYDAQWSCAQRPTSCSPSEYAPVCGCDHRVYDSACEAYAAGVGLSDSYCRDDQTPEGTIPCGPRYCDPNDEYCYWGYGDVGDQEYECRSLADLCGEPESPEDCCAYVDETLAADYDYVCEVVEGNGVRGVRISEAWW
jgi:hypothetical protein